MLKRNSIKMENYSIEDFKIGTVVYQLTNKDFRMIIERINLTKNEITCGWIGKDGKVLTVEFKPNELGKVSDLNRKPIAI